MIMEIGAFMTILGIIFIPIGLFAMFHRPLGKVTENDVQMAKLYPIGVGLLMFGIILSQGAKP